MGRTFWLMAVNCWLLFRLNPTAFTVALWGSLRRSLLRLTPTWFIGPAATHPVGRARSAQSKSRNSSMPSTGASGARPATPQYRVTIRPRMRSSKSPAPAPAVSWRTRWSRVRWMAWVAQNMYDDRTPVQLSNPCAVRETQRLRRLSRMRKSRPNS
jgi:hypothetical protein